MEDLGRRVVSGCGERKRRRDERKVVISRPRGGRRPTTDDIYIEFWGCAFERFKGRGGLRRKNAQVPEDARDPIVKTILVMGYKTDYKTSTL